MSDFYGNIESIRLTDYKNRLLRGEPREQAWSATGRWSDAGARQPGRIVDAVPMTSAETIMRREEALEMRWPLIKIIPGAIVPGDPAPIVFRKVEDCSHQLWLETYNGVMCPDCGKVW